MLSLSKIPLRPACVVFTLAAAISGPVASRAAVKDSPPQQFEDRPEPLISKVPRGEAELDRLTAAALFATGHTLEQRQDAPAALRNYARAVRLDPQAEPVLRDMVPLAYSLGRRGVAIRYAIKLANRDTSDPALLRRIGLYLTEEGDWKQAASLLEKALRLEEAQPNPTAVQSQLRMELGRAYFLLARYKDAARLFDKIVPALAKPKDYGLSPDEARKLVGDDGLNYEVMGTTYLEVDRAEDAVRAFEKLNSLAPSAAVAALNKARAEAKSKRPTEALAKLQAYFDAHPAEISMAALEILPGILKELHREDELLPRLEKLRKAWPDSIALLYVAAEAYLQAGKLAEAKPLYEAALKKQPTGDAYRALAEIYRKTNDLPAVLALLGRAQEQSGSIELLDKELKLIANDEKLCTSLIDLAKQKFAEPTQTNYIILRGAAALAAQRKQFDVAEPLYNLALQANHNVKEKVELLLTWGLELFVGEKYGAATKVFRRGLSEGQLPGEKPAFEYYLSGALESAGKTDEALAVVDKMMTDKKPKEARYAARRAWILFHAKRNDEASKAYKELIAKFDDDYENEDNRETLRDAREALSSLCVIQHRLPEAEERLQQVLDEFPDDVGAHNDLGYLWADQNKHLPRALGMIQLAVAAEPDNLAYRDSLGWAYFRTGRDAEALAELAKAAASDDADGTIVEHLGDVYEHMNEPGKSLECWRRAETSFAKQKDDERSREVAEKIARRKPPLDNSIK